MANCDGTSSAGCDASWLVGCVVRYNCNGMLGNVLVFDKYIRRVPRVVMGPYGLERLGAGQEVCPTGLLLHHHVGATCMVCLHHQTCHGHHAHRSNKAPSSLSFCTQYNAVTNAYIISMLTAHCSVFRHAASVSLRRHHGVLHRTASPQVRRLPPPYCLNLTHTPYTGLRNATHPSSRPPMQRSTAPCPPRGAQRDPAAANEHLSRHPLGNQQKHQSHR